MFIKEDNGYILITVLLLLLVLTVVGIAAIGTSSIENILSGNIRLSARNLSKSDAGQEIGPPAIEQLVREQNNTGFTNIIADPALSTELRSSAFSNDGYTDLSFTVDGQLVSVDIDKMYKFYCEGSAVESHSGYEGLGKGGGSNFCAYYRINSQSNDLLGSVTRTGTIYRYVQK